jgi:putative ABC transport system permease protein
VSYLEVPLPRLALVALLVVVAVAVSWRARLDLERSILWASVRGAVQLFAVGYALRLLFAHEHVLSLALALLSMLLVAAWTASRRVEHAPARTALFLPALAAIGAGGLVALVPVFAFVIVPTPWYSGRFVIPIAGMMLSNAMNVVALTFERVFAGARSEAPVIEQLLALGASPEQALHAQVRSALRAAMTPTLNGLLTVGLVALPGMMTGQIVSGIDPGSAVRYQLVVLFQLAAVAAVSGWCAASLSRRMLFTARAQLRPFEARRDDGS